VSPETERANDTGENTHRNGLSGVGAGICGLVGLDGGGYSRAKLVSEGIRGKIQGKNEKAAKILRGEPKEPSIDAGFHEKYA
jgi:hypothetical protein